MQNLNFDIAHLLAGSLVLVSFMLLYQDRLYALLNVYALHAVVLALSVAWQAYIQDAPQLYITAAIALLFKAIVIPVALHRMIVKLGIHREIETVGGIGLTMLLGMGLVALAMVVTLRATEGAGLLAREDLAFALSVVLLGLLMMVTRRNAVSQVVGFMSLENGLVLAATGAKGMPLVVEISVAFSILIAFIVIGIFLFRIRERFDTVDIAALDRYRGERRMSFGPVTCLFVIPALAAAVIALMPGSKLSAPMSMLARPCSLSSPRLSLLWSASAPGAYVLVDEFNTIFVVLITFVAFTTSAFSATYVEYELETGRVTPAFLKLYHALYQALTLCLRARAPQQQYRRDVGGDRACHAHHRGHGRHLPDARCDRGGVEIFHSRQRRHRARSVRHHPRLYGGGAGDGRRPQCHGVDRPRLPRRELEPAMLNLAFVFLLLGYGTKIGLFPLHAWLPDAHAEGPTPITAVLSGLLLNVALYALLRCKMLLAGNPDALAPGPLMIGMGLVSLLFGAFMLYRRRDIKRLFAYSSIEHMGLITFAFGSADRSRISPGCCTWRCIR